MGPNKKKKKGSANPARGFATTSVASKHKSEVDQRNEAADVTQESHTPAESAANDESTMRPNGTQIQTLERPLHELSAQELEAHLEENNLQNILDLHGSRMLPQVARQVARMCTEKRLLRSQGDSLNARLLLSDDVCNCITKYLQSHKEPIRELTYPTFSHEELLVHIWRLYHVLHDLHFSESDIHISLGLLLQAHLKGSYSSETRFRDSIWGLEHCIETLALISTDTANYDSSVQKPPDPLGSDLPVDDANYSDLDEMPAQLAEIKLHDNGAAPAVGDDGRDYIEPIDDISDLDSEIEPDQMVERFLSLKQRLSEHDPTILDRKPGKLKSQSKFGAASAQLNPRIKKIEAQLSALMADILFDQQQADMSWEAKRIDLLQEAITRKTLGVESRHSKNEHELSSSKVLIPSPKGTDLEEEPEGFLGDFLATLPDANSNIAATESDSKDTSSVEIRDFGKSSGVPPRRILEEICKARDASAKITFGVVAQTPFSCRHRMTINWSKPQQTILRSPLLSVEAYHRRQLLTGFEMVSVACPDVQQSESFISTVALFAICSHAAKEEKVFLRLSSGWRNLWEELGQKQKEISDTTERETLRSLRQLVNENTEASTKEVREAELSEIRGSNTDQEAGMHSSRENPSKSTFSKDMWMSRSASKAYHDMLFSRSQLPIYAYRSNILDAINENQIVIVAGATGCGKSTQVPAYILENELSKGNDCRIYCTEPRRISAISLARRVSVELGDTKNAVGTAQSLVGFVVRLDSRVHENNRLVYATTGIIMRMLESSPTLDEVTHLLLDEVHERSIETDFLLIILKKLLERRPSLRVVLMSATVDAQKFSKYLGGAPVFEVPGRTFPVEVQFLEDAIETTQYRLGKHYNEHIEEDAEDEEQESEQTPNANKLVADLSKYSPLTRTTLTNIDEYRIPYELIVKLLENIHSGRYEQYNQAILVFLPGIAEIRRLSSLLSGHQKFTGRCEIFTLHSTIASEEQEKVFSPPRRGMRKIVLATNIAETGITIPDITCVIDTGKHKEMRFDERRQLSRLIAAFVSQANAVQRRGRAGRVQNGLCFHLFSRQRFDKMAKEQTPEMLRLSLQDLVLRVKICGLGDIEQTLSEALDPPSSKNVRRAVDALQDVKALTPTQALTPLGRKLAGLPLDVFLGKTLILGTLFGCLDAVLTVAAILSSKSPFAASMGSQALADQARLHFKRGDSDLLTVYNAYCSWRRVCTSNTASESQFCRKNFLSTQTLSNIEDLKGQLMASLLDAGFIKLDHDERDQFNRTRHHHHRQRHFIDIPSRYNINNDVEPLFNSVNAASFYPKLLRREGKAFRNVSTNQTITLHPTSVNKQSSSNPPPNTQLNLRPPKWLSYYHIMATGSKHYNAHETSAVDEMALVCLCGEAEFKMYAGVVVIDGSRIRFKVQHWRTMIVLKSLRRGLKRAVERWIKEPGKGVGEEDAFWVDMFVKMMRRRESGSLV